VIPRVLETEAMDTLDEAVDYDAMDHAEVNRAMVADLLDALGTPPDEKTVVLDVGTGTAQIPVELCRQCPTARVVAADAARHMLDVARENVERAGLADRIRLDCVDGKRLPYADGSFSAVMSNSIVHHIPEPQAVLDEAWRVTAPGGLLYFRDLFRPADEETLRRLVDTYAEGASPHQRKMFADSLRAALTVEEMQTLVARYGQPLESVRATTDRHWTWTAWKS